MSRKEGYYGEEKHYVSVTKVLGLLAKPGLDSWKLDIGARGAVYNVLLELSNVLKNSPELVNEFIRRTDLLTSSGDYARAALQKEYEYATGLGSDLHNTIQAYFAGNEPTPNKEIEKPFYAVVEFIKEIGIVPESVEREIISERGYAGKLDLLTKIDDVMINKLKPYLYGRTDIKKGLTVCDWKTTKNVKSFYNESRWQISAYAKEVGADQGLIINVDKITGEIKVSPVDVEVGYVAFMSLFESWELCVAPQWWLKEWGLI